jgi:ATP adenylyltransferase
MEFLWSPWRNHYVTSGQAKQFEGCVFCSFAAPAAPEFDDEHYILFRGQHNFLLLNLFPYTTAHLMIVPYLHVAELAAVAKPITDEMMDLAKVAQRAIGLEYNPDGYNLGMNLGGAAGAGIAAHLHLHLLPRWSGDANFMTTVGETRVLPESLGNTYQKLKKHFQ